MNNFNNELKKSLDDRASYLHHRIIQSNLAIPERIKGCSEQEIKKLEQTYNLTLPYSYKLFLRHFGHGFAHIGNEFHYLYQEALSFTRDERNIEQEIRNEKDFNPEELLPENAFIFAMRYDMQMWYFIAEEGIEDPIVFYDAGDGDSEKMYESVFDFWEERVTNAEQLLARREGKMRQSKREE